MEKTRPAPSRALQEAFGLIESVIVDLKIVKELSSAGVPFTTLRNLEFANMLVVVNKAPKAYKPPSYEKARTSLLDKCKRNL